MTPDPVRHPHRPTLGKSRKPRAGGRVGILAAEAAAAVVHAQHRTLGAVCDQAAGVFEEAAELLRWLAALTRACP